MGVAATGYSSARPGQIRVRRPSSPYSKKPAPLRPRRAAELDHPLHHGAAGVLGVGEALAVGGVGRRLDDLEHQLHVQLVGQLQRPDGVTRLRRGPLEGLRVHALGEHRQALVDHEADDARGVEAAAVVDDDRRLADLLDDVVRLRQRLLRRLLALDDLDERHLVDGAEEVQPDEVGRSVDAGRQLGDRQGRGVRAQQRVRVHVRRHLGEDLVLEARVLEDRLDDEVAAREVGRVRGRRDPREQLGLLLLGRPPARDGLVEQLLGVRLAPLGRLGGDVLEDDLHAGAGARVRDARRPSSRRRARRPWSRGTSRCPAGAACRR